MNRNGKKLLNFFLLFGCLGCATVPKNIPAKKSECEMIQGFIQDLYMEYPISTNRNQKFGKYGCSFQLGSKSFTHSAENIALNFLTEDKVYEHFNCSLVDFLKKGWLLNYTKGPYKKCQPNISTEIYQPFGILAYKYPYYSEKGLGTRINRRNNQNNQFSKFEKTIKGSRHTEAEIEQYTNILYNVYSNLLPSKLRRVYNYLELQADSARAVKGQEIRDKILMSNTMPIIEAQKVLEESSGYISEKERAEFWADLSERLGVCDSIAKLELEGINAVTDRMYKAPREEFANYSNPRYRYKSCYRLMNDNRVSILANNMTQITSKIRMTRNAEHLPVLRDSLISGMPWRFFDNHDTVYDIIIARIEKAGDSLYIFMCKNLESEYEDIFRDNPIVNSEYFENRYASRYYSHRNDERADPRYNSPLERCRSMILDKYARNHQVKMALIYEGAFDEVSRNYRSYLFEGPFLGYLAAFYFYDTTSIARPLIRKSINYYSTETVMAYYNIFKTNVGSYAKGTETNYSGSGESYVIEKRFDPFFPSGTKIDPNGIDESFKDMLTFLKRFPPNSVEGKRMYKNICIYITEHSRESIW